MPPIIDLTFERIKERIREMKKKYPDYPIKTATYAEIKKKWVQPSHDLRIEAAIIESRPDKIAIGAYNPNGSKYVFAALVPREQVEEFARAILMVDPPIDQQVLAELREIRKAVSQKDPSQ